MSRDRLQVVFAAAQQEKNAHVRPTVPTPNRQKHLPEVQFTFTVRNQHHVLHKISSIMQHASLIPSSVVTMIELFLSVASSENTTPHAFTSLEKNSCLGASPIDQPAQLREQDRQ